MTNLTKLYIYFVSIWCDAIDFKTFSSLCSYIEGPTNKNSSKNVIHKFLHSFDGFQSADQRKVIIGILQLKVRAKIKFYWIVEMHTCPRIGGYIWSRSSA